MWGWYRFLNPIPFYFYYLKKFGCPLGHVVPQPEIEPALLQWKHRVLTTEHPSCSGLSL